MRPYLIILNKYWLETSKETERAIALCCTGSTIISILSESHQDLSATETQKKIKKYFGQTICRIQIYPFLQPNESRPTI